jgi:predicted nucleic acid-binding protein
MREVVVDASVSAKWVIEEHDSDKAALLLAYDARHAPDHWQAEAVNVLWSKVFRGDLTAADAEERMMLLLRAPVVGTPIQELMPRAFAISVANMVTIYDALYVALAEKRNIPLVTADERLIRRMSGDITLAKQLVWVGDLSA